MGFRRGIVIVWLLSPGLTVWAQQPQPVAGSAVAGSDLKTADPEKRADRPLTPDEERERAVRLYDPLNREDPAARGDRAGSTGTPVVEQRALPAPRALP